MNTMNTKKRKRKTLIITLALLMSIIFGQSHDYEIFAKMNKSKQHRIYQMLIKKYDVHMKKLTEENRGEKKLHTFYVFADIDKNGIDECILRYVEGKRCNTADRYSFGETTAIYTIKNGKTKAVRKMPLYYNPYMHDNYCTIYKNSSYIDCGLSHGYEDRMFFLYKNGKLSKRGISYISGIDVNNKKYATINEKRISVSAYKKKLKSIIGNQKGYQMRRF